MQNFRILFCFLCTVSVKLLYIFPHPDDESFGPSPVMHKQLAAGNEVHILTLTHGGATKERLKLGLDIEAMGKVRTLEMAEVKKALKPTSWEIWDLEDGGLTNLEPGHLEILIKEYIQLIKPQILITYPQHGISGHYDHLVVHSVVKKIFCDLRIREYGPKRLAFFTLPKTPDGVGNPNAKHSESELIDCVVQLNETNIDMLKATLACYKSYAEIVANYKVVEHIGHSVSFEFWDEDFKPPVSEVEFGILS